MEKNKRFLKAELIVFAVYIAGLIFVSCFHELWFDETQAWQIARSASYKDMLTVVPHYEGHPPLWYLLLSVFAKNGAPIDLTLKVINIITCAIAMALIIFRAPFPRPVRLILPFTYFFFYQYGIYARPYGLTMIAILLAAIFYKERNAHPWRYILSLVFLCLTTAYGIMISGGLCMVWTFEILTEMKKDKKLGTFWKDSRFYSLLFILVIAVMLMLSIVPAEDCYYGGVSVTLLDALTSIIRYQLLLIIPFESWSGVLIADNGIKYMPAIMIPEMFFGLAMWILLCAFAAKNKKFCTFFIPYFIMCCFMSFKYMSCHHLGISCIYHVFIFWIMAESDKGIEVPDFLKNFKGKIESPIIKKIVTAGLGVICLAPIVYSVGASINDIRLNCGTTRYAKIIKENHLENTKIMSRWITRYDTDDEDEDDQALDGGYMFMVLEIPSDHPRILEHRTYLNPTAATVLPYFDRNIIMNFNLDCPDDLYMHYKFNEDYEPILEAWREQGLPDFILGYCPLDEVYDEETLEGVRYLPIAKFENITFYKLDTDVFTERMYIREDLLDDYPQFHWVEDPRDNMF